jgi:hypothetical protein
MSSFDDFINGWHEDIYGELIETNPEYKAREELCDDLEFLFSEIDDMIDRIQALVICDTYRQSVVEDIIKQMHISVLKRTMAFEIKIERFNARYDRSIRIPEGLFDYENKIEYTRYLIGPVGETIDVDAVD